MMGRQRQFTAPAQRQTRNRRRNRFACGFDSAQRLAEREEVLEQKADGFPERMTTPFTSLPRSQRLKTDSSAMAALENTFIGRPGMSKTRCRTLFSLRSARNCCSFPNSSMASSPPLFFTL